MPRWPSAPAPVCVLAGSEQLEQGEGSAEPELRVFLASTGRNARMDASGNQ